MRRLLSQAAVLFAVLVLCVRAAGDQAAFRRALAALQRGDFQAAEQTLRPFVAAHPNDGPALSLLGVVLDNQSRFGEAVDFHRRAVAAAPRNSDVLSNYGSHLAATGKEGAARDMFVKVIALDPANVNANLQLARQAIQRKNGAEALRCLQRVPAGQLAVPETRADTPGSAIPGR